MGLPPESAPPVMPSFMKKALLVIAFLAFAVLMLPGIIHPPGESAANSGSDVRQLARALETALLEYRKEMGRFPAGGADEILSALRGKNDKGQSFIEIPQTAVNEQGEMLDPWGTPFEITFDEQRRIPKIHSAGPNREFQEKPSKHGDDYYSWRDPALVETFLPH